MLFQRVGEQLSFPTINPSIYTMGCRELSGLRPGADTLRDDARPYSLLASRGSRAAGSSLRQLDLTRATVATHEQLPTRQLSTSIFPEDTKSG